MAGDASGDRGDEPDRSRKSPPTETGGSGPNGGERTGRNLDTGTEGDPATGYDRIPLDLSSGPDERDSEEDDAEEADPYAPEPSSTPIEAGDPDLENAVFVVLGAIAMILVIVRVVSIPL